MRSSFLLLALLAAPLAVFAAPSWTASNFTQSVIMGVSFTDAQNGYIAGGDNGVGANALFSADGGNTFNSIPIHEPVMMLLAVAASSPKNAVIAGLGLLSGGSQYTNDGLVFLNSSEPKVSMQTTQDVELVTGLDAFAVTGQYQFFNDSATYNMVAFSADGGATFTFSNVGGDPNVPARYASFPSTTTGFVAAGTFPSSKKAGRKSISRNVHMHGSNVMHFTDKTKDAPAPPQWYASLYRSNDGAFATWTEVFSNSSFYFNQISCPSEQTCFVAGENDDYAVVYRTTDGGDSWEEILAAPGTSLMSVEALSEDVVIVGGGVIAATGVSGSVYTSTNGGDSFTLESVDGYYFTDMSFVDAEHGFASAMDTDQYCNVLIFA